MKQDKLLAILLMVIVHGSVMNAAASPEYSWLETYSPSEGIESRITVPRGYELDFGEELRTPEWIFHKGQLRRFRPPK